VAEDADDPTIIENLFAMEKWRGGMALVDHASTRTLVLSDIHMHFCAAYRNSVPGGKVCIDNVFCRNQFRPEIPVFDFKGQKVWARQINPERNNPEIRNDGGHVWIFGFKTEFHGTAFHTLNGGSTEVLGGTMNQSVKGDGESAPGILNENSNVSVVCGTTDWRDISFTRKIIVQETRDEQTRTMRWDAFPHRDANLIAVPLYVGRAAKQKKSPTRASLLTGKSPARLGLTQAIGGRFTGALCDVPYLFVRFRSCECKLY